MTITKDVSIEEFQVKARDWLADNAPKRGTPQGDEAGQGSGEMGSQEEKRAIARCKEFQGKLAEAGLAGITYPKEFGGAGLTPMHQAAFNAEAASYVLPTFPLYIGQGMCLPTIFTHGTDEQ